MSKILNSGTGNDNTPTIIANKKETIAAFNNEAIETDLNNQNTTIS